MTQFLDVGHEGIAHEAYVLNRTLSSTFVTVPAGVLDDNRYQAQVSAVAHSGIYSNFGGDPADHERNQATVTERHSQGCTFESRHRNLVENRFVRFDPQFRRKLKALDSLAGTMG